MRRFFSPIRISICAQLALLLALAAPAAARQAEARPSTALSVIVRERPGSGSAPERLVERAGGHVERRIGLIDGFVATVPARAVRPLRGLAGVHSVTPNRHVQLLSDLDGWDHTHDHGSMFVLGKETAGAGEFWNDRLTGKGVDVALIDSGVTQVNGLRTTGKLVHGPDLSFESQADNLRHLDTFGHGTHVAGIIAGRDDGVRPGDERSNNHFVGMAPDARIVSLKVADAFGRTDVSQVIAAIDWVVQHRRTDGLNIRVLNLSFGTDGEQNYRLDPLAYAAEVAWRKGIVVVVAAGNGGFGSEKLNNPAYDPFVIAVGGVDGKDTYDARDDTVPAWSSFGDGTRNPDLVAPGKSVVSLRVPGSFLDQQHASARVGRSRFFRGSGTSQAAAVVSGAAALIIQQRPTITPDRVKALLLATAMKLPAADPRGQGAGRIDLKRAVDASTPAAVQAWTPSVGTGSLDLARGSSRVTAEGIELRGDRDIFGRTWDGAHWAPAALAETSWSGGTWNGNAWTGNAWTGNAWTGNAWTGNAWTGNAWTGNAWTGNAWTGNAWTGNAWTGSAWTSSAWTSSTWGNAAAPAADD